MRIWSLHPKYLDAKGLVALWRETLLARHVLEGKTKGYRHHPQLIRFKATHHPIDSIDQYLLAVWEEAEKRGYHFDKTKIHKDFRMTRLPVTKGQLEYEWNHLLNKLKTRDKERYNAFVKVKQFEIHPLFYMVEGEVEEFEMNRLPDYWLRRT